MTLESDSYDKKKVASAKYDDLLLLGATPYQIRKIQINDSVFRDHNYSFDNFIFLLDNHQVLFENDTEYEVGDDLYDYVTIPEEYNGLLSEYFISHYPRVLLIIYKRWKSDLGRKHNEEIRLEESNNAAKIEIDKLLKGEKL